MHFLGYTAQIYLLLHVWSGGRILEVNERNHKDMLKKLTGIDTTNCTHDQAKESKRRIQATVEELQLLNRGKALMTPQQIAEGHGWSPTQKDRYNVYEGLCDAISIGIYGLSQWKQKMGRGK
jgi:hypothetical protein